MISILIPCYNEEEMLSNTYKRLKTELVCQDQPYEIIFCNDGSTDNTLKLLTEIERQDEKVKIMSYSPNKGPGYAFRQMYSKARGEILIHMDADLAMDPKETIPFFLEAIKHADIVIGSRYAGIKPQYPLRRRILSKIALLLNNTLFKCNFKDTNSGFFATRKAVKDKINMVSDTFEFQAELFIKAERKGFNIKEVPVKFIHKTKSSELNVIKHSFSMLKEIFILLFKS